MKLYNYFRSSASFRVRIALELKGIAYEYAPVHLARGDHKADAFRAIAPEVLVPLLEDGDLRLSQSMAIMEYLDDTHPEPRLLPPDPVARAQVRALSQSIACEIHPLNNLRVLKYLVSAMGQTEEQKNAWYRHWVREGLEGFERLLQSQDAARGQASSFCWGDGPTMADCTLVPQIFNARRFDVNLEGLPRTMAAFDRAMELPAFQRAQPKNCPDFEA